MTRVLDLKTGKELFFSIEPQESVVVAHEMAQGNNNTWAYDYTRVQYGPSGKTVFCGNFGAMLE